MSFNRKSANNNNSVATQEMLCKLSLLGIKIVKNSAKGGQTLIKGIANVAGLVDMHKHVITPDCLKDSVITSQNRILRQSIPSYLEHDEYAKIGNVIKISLVEVARLPWNRIKGFEIDLRSAFNYTNLRIKKIENIYSDLDYEHLAKYTSTDETISASCYGMLVDILLNEACERNIMKFMRDGKIDTRILENYFNIDHMFLSIGFVPIKLREEKFDGRKHILYKKTDLVKDMTVIAFKSIDIVEISLVNKPANQASVVIAAHKLAA